MNNGHATTLRRVAKSYHPKSLKDADKVAEAVEWAMQAEADIKRLEEWQMAAVRRINELERQAKVRL